MAKTYPMLSSDGHLEVLPERWTSRMPAQYRALAPHTTTLPDGSDAIVMEGSGPFKVNYIDLRGGRKAEDWQPVGVKVENTPGIGPPEQRVEEQDVDGRMMPRIRRRSGPTTIGWRKSTARWRQTASSAWRSSRGPLSTTPWRN